ncbi:MAG: hypothetical protein OIN66_10600 [Candidatus Methanoperedens sp.]|nr:hypothetical protein [Candidatus Methanoperedens sp.]
MDSENQLAKLGVRVLELQNHVILMCEKCGEIWNQDGSNSWVCPKGVTGIKTVKHVTVFALTF